MFINSIQGTITIPASSQEIKSFISDDINIDLIYYPSDLAATEVLNIYNCLALCPMISKPTRIIENTADLIDNIIMNDPVQPLSGIITAHAADHMAIIDLQKRFLRGKLSVNY